MASNSTPSPATQPAQTGQATSGQSAASPSEAAKTDTAKAGGKTATGRRGQRAAAQGSAATTSKTANADKGADKNANASKADGEAIRMLKSDHRQVEKLFKEFESASGSRKDAIVTEVCQALTLHTMLEEEVFYPACRAAADEDDDLDEAQVEHDSAKVLIADLARSARGFAPLPLRQVHTPSRTSSSWALGWLSRALWARLVSAIRRRPPR